MTDKKDNRDMVERFLANQMGVEERERFVDAVRNDPALKSLLERESGIEALAAIAGNMVPADSRYVQVMDRALGITAAPFRKKHSTWLGWYACAATVALMVTGGYIIHATQSRAGSSTGAVAENGGNEIPRSGKKIVELTSGTLFLAEEGATVRTVWNGDSSVNVLVSQGNICFDVAKGDDALVTVATPHAAIVLGSSVTRIVVTEIETEVAVLDGNATVIHRYNREMVDAHSGGTMVIADITAMRTSGATLPELYESRKLMFREYVSWVRRQAHG
jgi:hypothetical protein